MTVERLLAKEKIKRDGARIATGALERRKQAALERVYYGVRNEMGLLTQLELRGDYGRPVPVDQDRLQLLLPNRKILLDGKVAFKLGPAISPINVQAVAVNVDPSSSPDGREAELHVYLDRKHPFSSSEPLKLPLDAPEVAASAFLQHILDGCTAESIDRVAESIQVVEGQDVRGLIGPADFCNTKKKIIDELMENYPEACRLFGEVLALAEAEKRYQEYENGEYHNFDETSPKSVPPYTLGDLTVAFDNLCEAANTNDSVGVDFTQHHAFRTAFGLLHSLKLAGFEQVMPEGDDALTAIVKRYSSAEDPEFDNYEGFSPR